MNVVGAISTSDQKELERIAMKERLSLLVKVAISPHSLMKEVRDRRALWILLVYPTLAIIDAMSTPPQNSLELTTGAGPLSILILTIFLGVPPLITAAFMYIVSRVFRRGATITYLSFVSVIAFTRVPLLIEHLLMALFPFLSKSTAAGNKYFILSVGSILKVDLQSSMPFLFRIAAFELEPFSLWNFLLWMFLINVFFELKMWKSACIAVLLSVPGALLPSFI